MTTPHMPEEQQFLDALKRSPELRVALKALLETGKSPDDLAGKDDEPLKKAKSELPEPPDTSVQLAKDASSDDDKWDDYQNLSAYITIDGQPFEILLSMRTMHKTRPEVVAFSPCRGATFLRVSSPVARLLFSVSYTTSVALLR